MHVRDQLSGMQAENVKEMILGSAPERRRELEEFWQKYTINIRFLEDTQSPIVDAGSYSTIQFNHKGVLRIWIWCFLVQKAYRIYEPVINDAILHYNPISSLVPVGNPTRLSEIEICREMLQFITSFEGFGDPDMNRWPRGLPYPGRKPEDQDGMISFDFACLAGACTFLHEMSHVKISEDKNDMERLAEEFACDEFAREFLIRDIAIYSASSGYPEIKVAAKRWIAVGITGMKIIYMTPREHLRGSTTHPCVFERMEKIIAKIPAGTLEYVWDYISSLLLLYLHLNDIPAPNLIYVSKRPLCESLLRAARDHFPPPKP